MEGLYVLTASGELGVYDAQRQLQIDAPLSRQFSTHNRAFLQAYLQNPHADERRSAIVFESTQTRVWGRTSLSLEESVVRSLYPAGGRAVSGLTAFQQKSRELSVYRGLELLLEHRRESLPDVPVYCPVLFEPQQTLVQRGSALGRVPNEQERDIRVLDVLNLLATVPPARRAVAEVLILVEKLHQGIIRKELRSSSSLSVLQAQAKAVAQPGAEMLSLHETQRVASIERWVKTPPEPVGNEALHAFAQFRGLDIRHVDELLAPSLIYAAPAGVRLWEQGQSDLWNLYLLEGAVSLTAADGASVRVEGGSDKAANPIASLKPRKYRVDTLTPVRFLWLHDQLLAALAAKAQRPIG